MAMQESMGMLARAYKDLSVRWADARSAWKDGVAERLEEKYLKTWEKDFRSVAGQIEGMGAYLGQVRRDCE